MNKDFENTILNKVSIPKFYDLRMLPYKLVRDIYNISRYLLELNQMYNLNKVQVLDSEFIYNLEYIVSYIEKYFNYLENKNGKATLLERNKQNSKERP